MGHVVATVLRSEAAVPLGSSPVNFTARIAPRGRQVLVRSDADAPHRLYYIAVEAGDARLWLSEDPFRAADEDPLFLSASDRGARAMFVSSRNIRVATDNPDGAHVYVALIA